MDIERVAAAGLEPVVDEQRVQWEVEGYVTGHYAATDPAGRNAERDINLEPRVRWEITSLGAADWAMQQLARIEAVAREYDDEIARWAKLRANVARAGEFFRGHLERWAVSQRTDKRKSFPLAHGTVSTRESKPAPEVVDEEAAVGWCKVHAPDAVKITESVLISRVPVRVAEIIVGWRFTNRTTGDIVHVLDEFPIDGDTVKADLHHVVTVVLAEHASAFQQAADTIEAEWISTRLYEFTQGWSIEPVTTPGVVDADGLPADGFGIRPGKITSSVTVA